MHTATAIRTGVVLAVAVVLGLMVAPASHAFWSAFAPSNAGTIQAANFSVQLTGSPLNTTQEMTLPDGSPATIALTGPGAELAELYPGASITSAVQIANTTNASSDFTIGVTVPGPALIPASLSNHLTMTYATARTFSECSTATYGAYRQVAVDIPKGKTAALCFRIVLSASAPGVLSGQSGSIDIPLQVSQR